MGVLARSACESSDFFCLKAVDESPVCCQFDVRHIKLTSSSPAKLSRPPFPFMPFFFALTRLRTEPASSSSPPAAAVALG